MPTPTVIPVGCPPGLEYLSQIDQLLIHQVVEIFEGNPNLGKLEQAANLLVLNRPLMTNWETLNRFTVKNTMGQQVFFAAEKNDCLNLQCCGPIRSFEMSITDNSNREIIHLVRPLRCDECCFPCCLQEMEVQSPPGTTIGYIEQKWTIIFPEFNIMDANKNVLLKIKGPCWTCSCCKDVNFEVTSADGSQSVGRITKQWSGLAKEVFTDADNFGISFPMDLDVKAKATLLGAVFLIDFMFFEDSCNNNNYGGSN
ncbi:uncharacterized protein TRIADDRAFT_24229 [Trichoplax adhaerens]|uniref:Phospholipid scramblase n=1 Tax=Trichoplax adhaerens TaxID=10228 RepID=B3RTR3_TRIAD|nr:hypothetical protein TRIADDRAFT_24229 [Trichoplax adhaerens]EDV26178.1 hypothetical protein TRIADDRAFT_24229 [Trichoplax adhaerens]|eukprot:XP_002112211.1 hypothetical protein TRIADDRAFT_24229 [Trichoplax adhaerens]